MKNVLVVKLGSSSVTRESGPDGALLRHWLDEAIEAGRRGWSVVLISSGAVSSGQAYFSRFEEQISRRLAAAVGQPLLMNLYAAPPAPDFHATAQILISQGDLRSAAQMRVVADVLAECFDHGVVPIVNGNDVIDPDGSDNDSVATGIAVSVGARRLLLLTDVDGVYEGLPGESGVHVSLWAGDLRGVPVSRSGTGRGGMGSKLRAAELASHNGIETVIANARREGVITACVAGDEVGTRVPVTSAARPPEKRWIAGIARSHGRLTINREAEASITRGSSLFASGIKRVQGSFAAGDVIEVVAPDGRLIARGGANVSSSLLTLVRSMRSAEIGQVMAEIIYRYAQPGAEDTGSAEAGTEPRLPVRLALDAVRAASPAAQRRLAVELLELFPQTAVSCMTDASGPGGRERLAQYYERLSSDLSFIDRSHLVVF